MSVSKKVVVSLSEALYNEFNKALEEDRKKRSEFIKEAIILYIRDRKKMQNNLEKMQDGYLEMAELNLKISELGFDRDMKELNEYEVKLSESDFPR